MKTLTWVDTTRKAIKSKLGFGWSVQGIEKQNKGVIKSGCLSYLPPINRVNMHFLERVSAYYAGD